MSAKDGWAALGDRVRAACERKEDAPPERTGDGWEGKIDGFCPVQGKGTVDGMWWYFRARHDEWSFEVWRSPFGPNGELPRSETVWSTASRYVDGDGDASWMPFSHAWGYIEQSIAALRTAPSDDIAGLDPDEAELYGRRAR